MFQYQYLLNTVHYFC